MDFSLLNTSKFLPAEKWRCVKQKTTCYAGNVVNLRVFVKKRLYDNKVIEFIVTNNRITSRTVDFLNSPIVFWLCSYLNTAFHMAVISPARMFSVSAKLSIRADNGTYFGSFFHYPAYHLAAYGQG